MLAPTNVMLLEQLVQARQVLDDEVAQDPLVCLDAQQGSAEVGGREQVLDDGTHHPEGVLFLQEQQEACSHLAKAGGRGASTQVSRQIRRRTPSGVLMDCTPPSGLEPPCLATQLLLGDSHLPSFCPGWGSPLTWDLETPLGTPPSWGAHHACALAVADLRVEPGQGSENPAQAGHPNAAHGGKAGVARHGAEQVLLDLLAAPPNSENCEPPPSTLRPHERGWERPVQDKAKQGWGVLMPLSVTFLPAGSEPSQCGADSTRFNGGSYKNKLDLWASSQNYRISL